MSNTFTETDILRYLYGETTPAENKAIAEELKKNINLRSYYDRMVETQKELEKVFEEPDPTSVNIILEYSQATHHDSLEHH
ncbi:MAG: hypothetical protein EP332_06160 [Bacteroidetes bacterium]|nr:MAG: hypothetical protein EP332_06160 [Bacteroidota bacterium]